MKNLVKKNKNDKAISNLIAIIYFGIFIVQISTLIQYNLYNFMILLLFIFIIFSIIFNFRRNIFYLLKKSYKVYLFILVCSVLHIIFFPEIKKLFIIKSIRFLFLCIPSYILFQNISDISLLLNKFLKIFNYIFWISIIYCLLNILKILSNPNIYLMGLSYAMLPPILIATLKCKTIKTYLKVFFLLIFILKYGSRGAILAYLITIIIYFCNYFLRKKKYILFFLIFFVIIVGYKLKFYIFHILYKIFTYFGMNSRTILLLQKNNIHFSGRNEIWNNTISAIFKEPFSIKGIFSDHLITGINNYSHNIVLELLYQFGIFLGGILVLIITFIFIKSIFYNKETEAKKLLLIFSSISIVKLMLSSTLWESLEFWSWIGLYFNNYNIIGKRNTWNRKSILYKYFLINKTKK